MTEQGDLAADEAGHRPPAREPSIPLFRRHHLLLLACAVAIVSAPPAISGALLALAVLEARRQPDARAKVGSEPRESALDPWLDVALAGALAASLSLGRLASAPLAGLAWLPPLLAAAQLLGRVAVGDSSTRFIAATNSARAWFACGLLLTPLASLTSTAGASSWALTSHSLWFLVHLLAYLRWLLTRLDSRGVTRERPLGFLGKGSALRNATAALVATALDFGVYSLLVAWAVMSPPLATLAGAAAGGVLNFTMNRSWTFSASGRRRTMLRRYIMVSGASALLNAGFVAALLWLPEGQPTVAWLCARCLVFLCWNYPLQRDYVFAHQNGRTA